MSPRPPVLDAVCALVEALRDRLAIAAQQIDATTAPDLAAGLVGVEDGCARFELDMAAYNFKEGRHG